MKKKNILITNDDGYLGRGLFPLIEALCVLGDVTVVVPENNYSAGSHAITLDKSFSVRRITAFRRCRWKNYFLNRIGGRFYTVKGSSADCVRLAYMSLSPGRIDLVASGINDGSNLGTDIIYSATVAAAREAAIEGIPSIAISQVGISGNRDFSRSKMVSYLVCKKILEGCRSIPKHIYFNLNVPESFDLERSRVKLSMLGRRKYGRRFVRKSDGPDRYRYKILGEVINIESHKGSDVYCIKHNDAPITPVPLVCSCKSSLLFGSKWLKKLVDIKFLQYPA